MDCHCPQMKLKNSPCLQFRLTHLIITNTHSGFVKFQKLTWIQAVLVSTSYKCAGTNPSTHEVKSTLHRSRLNNTSMPGLLLKYQILLINGTSIPSRNWRREYAIGLKKNVFLWSSLIYSQVVKYLRKFMKLCYRSLLSEMLWDFNIYKLWWWEKKT